MAVDLRFIALSAAVAGAMCTAGCGGQGDTIEAENESVESVAARLAKSDVRPMPGLWESQMSIEKMEVPGLTDDVREMMKQQMGKASTSSRCLTKGQVESDTSEFFKPREQSGCTYNSFSMGGGKIEADMNCDEGAMNQTMTMSGTYDEQSYALNISAEGTVEGRPTSIEMAIKSRRVGECGEGEG